MVSAEARVLTASVERAHDLCLAGVWGRKGLRELSDGVSWEVRKSSTWDGFVSFPAHT